MQKVRHSKAPPTRDYWLSEFVCQLVANSELPPAKFDAVLARVRNSADRMNFNSAQLAKLEHAIAERMAWRAIHGFAA